MSEKAEGATRREFVAASAGAAAVAAFGFNRIAQAQDGDELITQIVKFKILEGQEDAAVELLETLTAAVEKGEPGVLAYIAHRSKNDPSEVVFFEIYKDQAALTAHSTTPHMAELGPKFAECFDLQSFDIQLLDRVGGFSR
ncbi:MAG: putative quinol monooxygenase [Candidatus Hydrogenedentes bacterium]|nr:antibiotic biosynthesis monooxygenase [Candidatus Hydrogenedentota bacterium]MDK1022164.1 putative quinol monooxygenase [Candidatus Hydrogenedentota bacterium]